MATCDGYYWRFETFAEGPPAADRREEADMSATITSAGIPVVIGGNVTPITGTEADEWIVATAGDDVVDALAGNDLVQGGAGNDDLTGGDGDDALLGDDGDDRLDGGAGSDVAQGGAGADTFVLAASSATAGDDTIVDFAAGDVFAVSAVDVVREDPGIELTGAGLDASDAFAVALAGEDGEDDEDGEDTPVEGPVDVVFTTPAGTTTVQGVDLAALGGDAAGLDFAGLEAAGVLTFDGLIQGAGDLQGTENDDVIVGSAEADTIAGLSGDDVLTGGAGSDSFAFDPSNTDEGADLVTDFELPSTTLGTPTPGDFVALQGAQVLAASPDLPAADGDPTLLTLADFDAATDWSIGASANDFLLVTHPNGTIEFQDLPALPVTFEDLDPILLVDGAAFPDEGIPIDTGGDGADDDATDDDATDDETTDDAAPEDAAPEDGAPEDAGDDVADAADEGVADVVEAGDDAAAVGDLMAGMPDLDIA